MFWNAKTAVIQCAAMDECNLSEGIDRTPSGNARNCLSRLKMVDPFVTTME